MWEVQYNYRCFFPRLAGLSGTILSVRHREYRVKVICIGAEVNLRMDAVRCSMNAKRF